MKSEHFIAPDQRLNITPLYYGFETCSDTQLPGYGNRGHYLFHYVFEGCGIIKKDGKIFTASKDDIFIFTPNDPTAQYYPDKETPCVYAWVAFSAEGFLPDFSEPVIHEPSVKNIFSVLREHSEELPVWRLYALIHELLWILGQNQPPKVVRNYAERAKFYLEMDLYNTSIAHVARIMYIDRRYLTRLFREAYGITPQQYQMKLRMEKARELLLNGFSVSDTAVFSGFSDLSNFSKKYKQYYGITPQQQKPK